MRIFLGLSLSLVATAAMATEVNLTAPITDPAGVIYQDCAQMEGGKCVKPIDVTLGELVITAMNSTGGDAAAQVLNFKVLEAVVHAKSGSGKADLSADEAKRIVDALWAWREQVNSKGRDVPLYMIAQAVKMVDPGSIK